MIDFRLIRFSDHLDALDQMLYEHWIEMGRHRDEAPLDPDYICAAQLQDSEHLFTVGAFDDDEMIGYSVNILTPMLHSRDTLAAQNAVLWLRPEYRKGFTGVRLIQFTEAMAKGMGCRILLLSARPDTVMFELLPKLKYDVHETVYSRVL